MNCDTSCLAIGLMPSTLACSLGGEGLNESVLVSAGRILYRYFEASILLCLPITKNISKNEIFSSNRRKLIYLFAPEQLYLINEHSSHLSAENPLNRISLLIASPSWNSQATSSFHFPFSASSPLGQQLACVQEETSLAR